MVIATTPAQQTDFARIFAEWPVSITRKGVLITSFGESVPFADFMLNGNLILVDRGIPDTAGSRRVILAIDSSVGIKITDPVEMARFTAMGFQGQLNR